MRIWTLLLSIYIDSKDLQSNFEVPAVFGSAYFWVSLYKLPTVVFGSSLWREQTIKKWKAKISTTYIAKVLRIISSFNRIYDIATISWSIFFLFKVVDLETSLCYWCQNTVWPKKKLSKIIYCLNLRYMFQFIRNSIFALLR